jgi:1,4-dihydroxy-2-naphthoate octaprenyltransferase
MSKISAWLNAMRLRTLPLSLSGIILGSGIAYHNGFWNWTIFLFAIFTTVCFQILSNFANDLGDSIKGTDNAFRVGPKRAVQSGLISEQQMKNGVIITAIISAISAGFLIYFGTLEKDVNFIIAYAVLALLCIMAAVLYTLGKKAYGYHGLGDLMVFIFFGLVSVVGAYTLYSGEFDATIVLPGATIGLLSTAVLNLNNMRDYKNDKRSDKNTIVVKMGPNMAKLYHAILILLALSSMIVFLGGLHDELVFACLLPFVILFFHIRKVMSITVLQEFDAELFKVAISTFTLSVLFFVSVVISHQPN